MSNRLTREQVGERLRIIAATMPSTGTDRIKAAAEIMNNDAALRARITELESMTLIERSQHLDTLTAEVERLQQRNTEIQTSLSIATERIVQVEEERDEANDSFASNMLIMWTKVKEVFPHVENYEQFWGELATLQSHLTQAQADLQEALRCKHWGEIYDWHGKRHRKLVELTDQLTQAQERERTLREVLEKLADCPDWSGALDLYNSGVANQDDAYRAAWYKVSLVAHAALQTPPQEVL